VYGWSGTPCIFVVFWGKSLMYTSPNVYICCPQTNVRIFALHALHVCLKMIHNIAYCFTDLLFSFIYILRATVRRSTICIRSFIFATIATLKGLFTFLTSVIFIRYHLAHRDDNKRNKFGYVINYGCNNVSEGPGHAALKQSKLITRFRIFVYVRV